MIKKKEAFKKLVEEFGFTALEAIDILSDKVTAKIAEKLPSKNTRKWKRGDNTILDIFNKFMRGRKRGSAIFTHDWIKFANQHGRTNASSISSALNSCKGWGYISQATEDYGSGRYIVVEEFK